MSGAGEKQKNAKEDKYYMWLFFISEIRYYCPQLNESTTRYNYHFSPFNRK
jgi:hypothetical protein